MSDIDWEKEEESQKVNKLELLLKEVNLEEWKLNILSK